MLFVKPIWGIGNRLRVLRKAFALSNILNRRLVVVESNDTFFDYKSMKELFGIDDLDFISTDEYDDIKLKHHDDIYYIKRDENSCETGDHLNIQQLSKTKNKMLSLDATCDVLNDELNEDNDFYKLVPSVFNDYEYEKITIRQRFSRNPFIKGAGKIVGVHIRQGSIADYVNGNFFGTWNNSDKTNYPLFPQFKDRRKNLSAYHPSAASIEDFIEAMNRYDKSTMFFICSDRIGTLLYLYQKFPNRILMNPLVMPNKKPNSRVALQDLLTLSKCDEIIISGIGSFSFEASMIRKVPIINIR